jgi:2-oxoisovalerate dehydrogenase E1 component alpha subunit
MTYRMGDHSTSDNSTLYRDETERQIWKTKKDPIQRLTKFLNNAGVQGVPDEQYERTEVRKEITDALRKCYKHKNPTILSMFDDVYDKLPVHL